MLSNLLKDRVLIQEKVTTQTATGQTITWKPVQYHYALKTPLSVQARADYQKINSIVTDKYTFRGEVNISLGNNRIVHGSKTYEPAQPPQLISGNTVVVVVEV